jgi:hypothetical protein
LVTLLAFPYTGLSDTKMQSAETFLASFHPVVANKKFLLSGETNFVNGASV